MAIGPNATSNEASGIRAAYRVLGLEDVTGGDDVFRHLVLARIIEPSSKLDSLRVLEEAGIAPESYATVKHRLPEYAREEWRQRLSAACATHVGLGTASLVAGRAGEATPSPLRLTRGHRQR